MLLRVRGPRPLRQCVYGYKVWAVLAVWVSDHAPQEGLEGRGPPAVRAKEQTSLVVVISVQVVPNDGRPAQDGAYFPDVF